MADAYIQVPADSVGKKVATQEVTRADASVVERQEVVLAEVQDRKIETLLTEVIYEIRQLKFALLEALH